jgi:hypothetical protein
MALRFVNGSHHHSKTALRFVMGFDALKLFNSAIIQPLFFS